MPSSLVYAIYKYVRRLPITPSSSLRPPINHIKTCFPLVHRFRSGKKKDNNVLSCDLVVKMLSAAAGCNLRLVHVHRSDIAFAEPKPLPMDETARLKLISLTRWEGHVSLKQRFGMGPWANGLENRGNDTTVLV